MGMFDLFNIFGNSQPNNGGGGSWGPPPAPRPQPAPAPRPYINGSAPISQGARDAAIFGGNIGKSNPVASTANAAKFRAVATPPNAGGGGGNGIDWSQYQGWGVNEAQADFAARGNREQPRADFENNQRNEINSGYDSYFKNLDDMLGGLGNQRQAQENIANSQYSQGQNTLDLQRTQGMQQLGTQRNQAEQQQARTLRDISGNIRDSMQAGNLYLGARGAGDSSAANQYAYALTKLGTQQRGQTMDQTANIFNDIGQRETNLSNIYSTEIKNLGEAKDQKINQVASWFADAQNQLKQAQASGQLSKSKDLQTLSTNMYNQALAQINQIQAAEQSHRSQLETWAMNNAKDIQGLKANMQAIGGATYNPVQTPAFNGMPQGGANAPTSPYFPGAPIASSQQKDIFNRPIQ